MKFSPAENQLLDQLQRALPVCESPWKVIAEKTGLSEEEVLAVLSKLRAEDSVIRRIGAIFDGRQLGYKSALVALRVSPERIAGAAAIIGTHPGVSHNYEREADFNLWYTIAVPPEDSLEETVGRLSELAAAQKSRILPELVRYKIGVKLDTGGSDPGDREEVPPPVQPPRESPACPSGTDIACIRVLQEDFPIDPRPFRIMAAKVGITEQELLRRTESFRARGQLRRVAAVLRHRKAGYVANAMGVWRVPRERADEVGAIMASFRRVSHCYRRPVYDDWPYRLYTMIHGRSAEECEQVAEMIAREAGVQDYRLLYTGREFKKTRVRYFVPEFEEWRKRFFVARKQDARRESSNRGTMFVAPTKIRSREEAAVIVKALKAMGHTVVFTHGCFDVLRAGHVRFLEKARALGEVLVVGVNTDASASELEGAGRPLLAEQERAALVASLRTVDHVVLFHERTADALLRELQPTVLAKGMDYTEETVPERETVSAYGGKIAIVGDLEDRSICRLVDDLANRSMQGDGR